ncbi:phosphoribosyltransferase family protein [Candidatus Desulforudis audaxviator]|uniref:phosphoribosyltransferase family protein n=1 Tax=Candidatus Desulforudis audaxviator TaxID=471827 RepID=UPI000304E3F8|nr:phosphoribosyltransferase family protein [Candidatus Desulforudis audaxviator]
MSSLREVLDGLVRLVFPGPGGCPICGAGAAGALCPACRGEIEGLSGQPYCDRCGRFFSPVPAPEPRLCRDCRRVARPFECCRAYAPYEGVLCEAVHRLKYGRRRELAGPLGELLARTIRRYEAYSGADVLVPVPLSREAFRRRRFNQAELLAREIGGQLGIPVRSVLDKIRDTPAQAGLLRAARLTNLAGCFRFVDEPQTVRGRTVVVVDDVLTTGSTLSEAGRVLLETGASRVLGAVLVAARVQF